MTDAIKQFKKKYQSGGSMERMSNYGDNHKSPSVSKAYKAATTGKKGLAYDLANLGLYAAAPFTAGATIYPAAAMSVARGAGAVANMIDEGVNPNNFIDAISSGIAVNWAPAARYALKNANLYKGIGKALMPKVNQNIVKIPEIHKATDIIQKNYPYMINNNIYKGIPYSVLNPQISVDASRKAAQGFLNEGNRMWREGNILNGMSGLMQAMPITTDVIEMNEE